MGCLVAPSSVIYAMFEEKRHLEGPKAATSWFYEMQEMEEKQLDGIRI
ncbi:hypothetical protein [Bacillus stratosphericus]|nr:hypothetical protein [Bacillus stratosphericus]